ncbi:hypothetical protein LTR64_003769 [Lithohypha guttulata]|uniref:uncharacterized protein n=1 Tax=Lithohypha guttulata TaxID=1690604 RepID=UPI002DDF0E0A|nr:hypothetical protein LTR51_000011 [Lithohypha guttulata]
MAIDYHPLNRSNAEIRLLEILGHGQDPRYRLLPSCHIFQAPLKSKPDFVALSYAWGDASDKRLILVNDSPVYITANLYAAITALRYSEQSRVFWIDALCINQEDDVEKSWQVNLMKDIYQRASQVLAWLGPACDDSDQVMKFLNTIGRKAEACGVTSVHGHHLDVWREMASKGPLTAKQDPSSPCIGVVRGRLRLIPLQALVDLFHAISGWHGETSRFPVAGMQRLFTRPWWGRVWVLQEITLPAKAFFVCGSQGISRHRCRAALSAYIALWMVLMRNCHNGVWSFLPYHTRIMTTLFHHRPNIMLCGQDLHQRDRFPLAAFLRATCVGSVNLRRHGPHHLESTDPRDKIFALLSLASDQEWLQRRGVIPDYTRTCQDVYTLAMAVMLEQGHISLLSLCQRPKVQHHLPSWVVDWSRSATDMLQDVENDHVTLCPAFATSSGMDDSPNVVVKRRDGRVTGIMLSCQLYDKIRAVGYFVKRESTHEVPLDETFTWPARWLLEILRLSYLHKKDDDFRERLAAATRTSIGDVGYDSQGQLIRIGHKRFSDAVTLLKCSLRFIKHRRTRLDAKKFLTALTAEETAACKPLIETKLNSEIIGKSLGRLPFVTEKGHLVLSSEHVRAGDVIALVKGSQVPFVLRPSHTSAYSLISEAYVDGIMNGEAVTPVEFRLTKLV